MPWMGRPTIHVDACPLHLHISSTSSLHPHEVGLLIVCKLTTDSDDECDERYMQWLPEEHFTYLWYGCVLLQAAVQRKFKRPVNREMASTGRNHRDSSNSNMSFYHCQPQSYWRFLSRKYRHRDSNYWHCAGMRHRRTGNVTSQYRYAAITFLHATNPSHSHQVIPIPTQMSLHRWLKFTSRR